MKELRWTLGLSLLCLVILYVVAMIMNDTRPIVFWAYAVILYVIGRMMWYYCCDLCRYPRNRRL